MRLLSLAALATLAVALSGCDSLSARMQAQEGVRLYRAGKIFEAAAKFEAAEKLDPYIPAIQLNLAFANLSVFQAGPATPVGKAAATKSINGFIRYLHLRPNEERAVSYLVQTFIDTGNYDAALAYFKPRADASPPDGEAIGILGTIASKTGRHDEARRWYERRVAVEPNNMDARTSLGVLLWDYLKLHSEVTGQERIDIANTALGHLEEVMKQKPNAPTPFTYANLVYRERALGQTDPVAKEADLAKARELFAKAKELQKGTDGNQASKKGGK